MCGSIGTKLNAALIAGALTLGAITSSSEAPQATPEITELTKDTANSIDKSLEAK